MGRYDQLTGSKPMHDGDDKHDDAEVVTPVPVAPDRDIKISSKISPKISRKISNEISPSVTGELDPYTDAVRKAVRWPGKESSPLRITNDELLKLKAAVRYFEDRGYFTDRTQIMRIALNYILNDFERNNGHSVLEEVMDRINNY